MNQEAIEFFEALKQDEYAFSARDKEMFDVAIQALKEPTRDLISRQAVLDKAIRIPIAKIVTEDKVIYRRVVFVDEIEQMPSAEKTGHWICGLSWKCSECGYEDDRALGTDFCPNCGARMVEPQESEVSNG